MKDSEADSLKVDKDSSQRFQDFTRAIIAVPKSEIDRAAKELPPQKAKAQRIEKSESE